MPKAEWESPVWQRRHSVVSVQGLKAVFGPLIPDVLLEGIAEDQDRFATMPLRVTPHMLNAMDERDLVRDPVRRYMLPSCLDRRHVPVSHPRAGSDSLREADMWIAEGLVQRYPTKALATLSASCPVYCGHCTRTYLTGPSTRRARRRRFRLALGPRCERMLERLRASPEIRDVVLSGGDVADVPMGFLETFVSSLMDIPHLRDIRLDSKALIGLPQHFLQARVLDGLHRLASKGWARGVDLCLHTQANHGSQITASVSQAARAVRSAGVRDIRNQGVLLRGVNSEAPDLLELCARSRDHAGIIPYYFYMCDMIPNCEHWRLALWEAQRLQEALLDRLPGFATPRLVCDVPLLGKQWVHQAADYDRERGISYWTKNYLTPLESGDGDALHRRYAYYDPIHTLPESGRRWWAAAGRRSGSSGLPAEE